MWRALVAVIKHRRPSPLISPTPPPPHQSPIRCRGRFAALEPVALTHGPLHGKEGVLARIHDQCLTSEVFGSKRCDCKEQLGMALDRVGAQWLWRC